MRIHSTTFPPARISADVLQGTVIASTFFNLFISDQPNSNKVLIDNFTDVIPIIANNIDSNLVYLCILT